MKYPAFMPTYISIPRYNLSFPTSSSLSGSTLGGNPPIASEAVNVEMGKNMLTA
ncbi:hypothetical protein P0F02_002663 [Vibrio metschnikovii]|nr:hypothetical protein [Vibrio metschnikovii]